MRFFSLVIAIPLAGAVNVLRQVHVITRHGSRYPPMRNAKGETKDLQDTLTPMGEEQLYYLGKWLKERYAGKMNETYSAPRVRLESAERDYTVVSAYALAQGLFDASSRDPHNESTFSFPRPNVPVYTTKPTNDVVFQAYDKCHAFNETLKTLVAGDEFKKLQHKYRAILERLPKVAEFSEYKDASTNSFLLQDMWKVFDLVEFAKAECEEHDRTACRAVSHIQHVLTRHEWGELQDLTHAVELLKFDRTVAGTLLGGPLLLRMTERMGRSEFDDGVAKGDGNDDDAIGNAKFFLYSGHYQTILAVLAAIGESPVDKVIPSAGSALLFELYDRHNTLEADYFVKIYYKSGDNKTAVPLGTVCSRTADRECPLFQFVEYVDNQIAAKNWCQECGNDSADVCLVSKASVTASAPNETTVSSSSSSLRSSDSVGFSILGTFIGLFVGFFGALLLQWFQAQRRVRKSVDAAHTCSAADTTMTQDSSDEPRLSTEATLT